MVNVGEIRHWNPDVLQQVFDTANARAKSLTHLGEGIGQVANNLNEWGGVTAQAWHDSAGKLRVDLGDHSAQAEKVAAAVKPAVDDVRDIKNTLGYLEQAAADPSLDAKITDDGKVVPNKAVRDGDVDRTQHLQSLQEQVTALEQKATSTEQEVAAALRAAVAGSPAPAEPPKPGDPTNAAGMTPADQLPLRAKDGTAPSVTEINGRHTGPESGPDYMRTSPQASPLLAGLSADEWRERLAHFQPGDPLPDPRTPTGDKNIDTIANAAGQQNTTYAWGGNRDKDGPSRGTLQGDPVGIPGDPNHPPGGAHQFNDDQRVGYDCGGLVRYSLQQGAGIDVNQGTDLIDRNTTDLGRVAPHVPSANIDNSVAQPGNILVFGGSQPWGAAWDTDHTGIYIGNGYMINAPESGEPIRVDSLGGRRDSADILKIGK